MKQDGQRRMAVEMMYSMYARLFGHKVGEEGVLLLVEMVGEGGEEVVNVVESVDVYDSLHSINKNYHRFCLFLNRSMTCSSQTSDTYHSDGKKRNTYCLVSRHLRPSPAMMASRFFLRG